MPTSRKWWSKLKNLAVTKFKVGELVKRKTLSDGRSRAVCVIVDKDEDNYTVYNNSLKCLQTIAVPVVEGMYIKLYT